MKLHCSTHNQQNKKLQNWFSQIDEWAKIEIKVTATLNIDNINEKEKKIAKC